MTCQDEEEEEEERSDDGFGDGARMDEDGDMEGAMVEADMNQQIVLHEDKKYYPEVGAWLVRAQLSASNI
jgi:hypothetical protein